MYVLQSWKVQVMKSLKSLLIILITLVILTGHIEASVIFSHTGSTDPTNEGWVVEPSFAPSGRPSSGGISNDAGSGFNAWFINDDLSTLGSTWFYTKTPTPEENNQANTFGWTLRARLRIVDTPDLVSNAGAIIFEYADGVTSYRMALGAEADGDPIVLLTDGGSTNGSTEATGASFTLDGGGNGYHLYEMVFDPVIGSVDLFIDGIERLSDYTGIASTLFNRVAWGAGSSFDTGQSNWNLVEWNVMPTQSMTSLRMQTDLGSIDIELFDNATPLTVANFLIDANDTDYDGSFIHRSAPGFVLQMGGFECDPDAGEFFY